jgi:hypothetical protein
MGKIFFPESLTLSLLHFLLPHGHAVDEGKDVRQLHGWFIELDRPVFADEHHPKFISRDPKAPSQRLDFRPVQDGLSHPALTIVEQGKNDKIPVGDTFPLLLQLVHQLLKGRGLRRGGKNQEQPRGVRSTIPRFT